MNRRILVAAAAAFAGLTLLAVPVFPGQNTESSVAPRFRTIDITLETADSLAAYQLELVAKGDVQLLAVEGGVSPFDEPPYYDLEALGQRRVVVAALSATDVLPPGTHRVVTLHVREAGPTPEYSLTVQAAGDAGGNRVAAVAALGIGGAR